MTFLAGAVYDEAPLAFAQSYTAMVTYRLSLSGLPATATRNDATSIRKAIVIQIGQWNSTSRTPMDDRLSRTLARPPACQDNNEYLARVQTVTVARGLDEIQVPNAQTMTMTK